MSVEGSDYYPKSAILHPAIARFEHFLCNNLSNSPRLTCQGPSYITNHILWKIL